MMRSKPTEKLYQRYLKQKHENCPFCDGSGKIIEKFQHWFIRENNFPYDAIAKKSRLLVSKYHTDNMFTLPLSAIIELLYIREMKLHSPTAEFNGMIENGSSIRTVANHLHFHLITYK